MRGIQLHAPEGWMNLKKGDIYYLLKNHAVKKTVFLVIYIQNESNQYRAEIIQMDRFNFEEGLKANAIQQVSKQSLLPPWQDEYEGVDFATIKKGQIKENFEKRVDEKVNIIKNAVNDLEIILDSHDPRKKIHEYARESNPVQNESRFRTELLTYLLFSFNKWVLLPNYCGVKGVKDNKSTVKQGAPSLANGKNYGSKMTAEMREISKNGFLEFADNTKFLCSVFIEVLKKKFGCKVINNNGKLEIISSKPYPTFNQFKYVIDSSIGKETRQKILYGEARFRNKKSPSKGRFSEEISNIYEKVYADAYQVAARPRGAKDGAVLAPLHGVVAVDALAGMPLGIGHCFGSEHSSGYRMMFFCMAIDKKKFCSLFGIQIEEKEWPSKGLPAHCMMDRGPGAKSNIIEEFKNRLIIRELSKSWSGQSKAPVETTHPKESKIEGKPSYKVANLTPYELVVAEILRILEYINSTNVEDRIDPLPELVDIYPTPLGIFNHYNNLYKNDAVQISFEEAVRTFLTKVEFTVKEDAIYLHSRMFNCEELRETGIFGLGETKVEGYILDLCVRFVWIEWKGKLIEVPALHRIRGLEEDLYLSIAELEQISHERAKKRSQLNADKVPGRLQAKQRFEEVTGKDYDNAIKSKRGKVPKNDVSKHEGSEVFASKNLKKAGGR